MPPLDSPDDPKRKGTASVPGDSLSGANHPLAPPPLDSKPESAVEITRNSSGQDEKKPLSRLSAGDHTIEFQDGRQFMVHVPQTDGSKTLPAMFVFTGSGEPQYNIKDFAPETGMSGVADEDPKHPFVVVYALPKEHPLGVYSKQPAYGWNTTGVLIDEQDRQKAGYDDVDYVKSIANLMPQLAKVDDSHKDWGAIAFSQGGVFLNKLVATVPELFPSVGLIGTSMQEDYRYDVKPGNAKAVDIVELLGDKITLPMRGIFSQSLKYDQQLVERFVLHDLNIGSFHGKAIIEGTEPLAAIHNENQNPKLENRLYVHRLGQEGRDYSVTRTELPSPAADKKKDFEIDYTPKDPGDNRRVTVIGLVKAQHSYPAPLYGPRTNATLKYTEFDASRQFAKMFDQYNDQVHASQVAAIPQSVAH